MTSKPIQSREKLENVRSDGPILEQAQPSPNPQSEGNSKDSIDMNHISGGGVRNYRQGNKIKKPLRIKGLDLYVDDEDVIDVLELIKVRKRVREEKERKRRKI